MHKIRSKMHQNALMRWRLRELKTLPQTPLPEAGAQPQTPLGELTALPKTPLPPGEKSEKTEKSIFQKSAPPFTKS